MNGNDNADKAEFGAMTPEHCERDVIPRLGTIVDETVSWDDGIQIKDGMIARPNHALGDIFIIRFPKNRKQSIARVTTSDT